MLMLPIPMKKKKKKFLFPHHTPEGFSPQPSGTKFDYLPTAHAAVSFFAWVQEKKQQKTGFLERTHLEFQFGFALITSKCLLVCVD